MYTIYLEQLKDPEVLLAEIFDPNLPNATVTDFKTRTGTIVSLGQALMKDYRNWTDAKRSLLSPAELCVTYDEFLMYCSGLISYCEAIKDPYYYAAYRDAETLLSVDKITQKDRELFAKTLLAPLDAMSKSLIEFSQLLKVNRKMFR